MYGLHSHYDDSGSVSIPFSSVSPDIASAFRDVSTAPSSCRGETILVTSLNMSAKVIDLSGIHCTRAGSQGVKAAARTRQKARACQFKMTCASIFCGAHGTLGPLMC